MSELTQKEIQWLLSLSEISLLGPKGDIDAISSKGIFGIFKQANIEIEPCISMSKDAFLAHKNSILRFLDVFTITNAQSYEQRINELVSGTQYSKNIDRLVHIMKLMSHEDYEQKKSLCVNGYTFSTSMLECIKDYEFHWPKDGMLAYDLANTVMLLRLGVGLGYIDKEKQLDYFGLVYPISKEIFTSYQQFGCDAAIGRNIHIHYLKNSRSKDIVYEQSSIFAMAYFGLWKLME